MYRDIIVHLDNGPADEARIAFADHLAGMFKAHLTGLFINMIPGMSMPIEAGYIGAQILADLQREAEIEGARIQEMLAGKLGRLAGPTEVRRIDAIIDEGAQRAAMEARWADTFICSRPAPNTPSGLPDWQTLCEQVLFGSGRSLFLLPDRPASLGLERILIAWNGSREATRAVAEAMPLLRKAKQVTIATVDRGDPAHDQPGADLARHLDRQDVKVALHNMQGGGNAADILLNEARSRDAGLIVMGGYGHSRLREWVLGGVTRDLMARTPIPLLMAH